MKILEDCSEASQRAMTTILDAFSGADGGVKFVALCQLINKVEAEAKEGKEAAIELLLILHRFGRLVDIA